MKLIGFRVLYFSFSNWRMNGDTLKSLLPCFYEAKNKDINKEKIIRLKKQKKTQKK